MKLASAVTCHGIECMVDAIRTVKVYDPNSQLVRWYLYRPPPCIRLTFARDMRYTSMKQKTSAHITSVQTCPRLCLAQCVVMGLTRDKGESDFKPVLSPTGHAGYCLYANEKVRYDTAASRCARRMEKSFATTIICGLVTRMH